MSPKIAGNARLGGGISARASYGRGFRAPDIGQLYYRFLNPSSIYQVIGNMNLQPEYANSLQIGGEYATPARRARFGFNLFRNDVEDLIESVSLGFAATPAQVIEIMTREGLDMSFRPVAGRLLLTYKNINNAVTEGVELDGEVAITPSLSLAGAYTYLDARDDGDGSAADGPQRASGNGSRDVARALWLHRQPPRELRERVGCGTRNRQRSAVGHPGSRLRDLGCICVAAYSSRPERVCCDRQPRG